jgi:hypothetical protein
MKHWPIPSESIANASKPACGQANCGASPDTNSRQEAAYAELFYTLSIVAKEHYLAAAGADRPDSVPKAFSAVCLLSIVTVIAASLLR